MSCVVLPSSSVLASSVFVLQHVSCSCRRTLLSFSRFSWDALVWGGKTRLADTDRRGSEAEKRGEKSGKARGVRENKKKAEAKAGSRTRSRKVPRGLVA